MSGISRLIYYHVKDKADLARRVVSAVNRQDPMQPPTGGDRRTWRNDHGIV